MVKWHNIYNGCYRCSNIFQNKFYVIFTIILKILFEAQAGWPVSTKKKKKKKELRVLFEMLPLRFERE